MPQMSKAEAKAEAEANKAQTINCPVPGCRRELALQPHLDQPGRLVAYCRCDGQWQGRAVYETDEIQPLADQEENNGST